MVEKENKGISDFISKYLRDDSDVKPVNGLSIFRFRNEKVTETFNNVGEPDSYSEEVKGYGKREDNKFEEGESSEPREKIEVKSPIAEAKKEFLDEIENQSLTLDTCSQINRDWGRSK